MAFQGDTQGQLQDFLKILRKRVPQVLLVTAFVTTIGVCVAVLVPKKYMVEQRVELRPSRIPDPFVNTSTAGAVTQEVSNAEYHLRHAARVQRVLGELDWVDYAKLDSWGEQNEYIKMVMKNIDVDVLEKPSKGGSTFVDIKYYDVDPERAVSFIQRLTKVWIEDVVDRDRKLLEEELDQAQNDRAEVVRLHKEKAEERRKLQRELQIPSVAPGTPLPPNDPVFDELKRVQIDAGKLREDIAATRAELASYEEEYLATPASIPIPGKVAANDVGSRVAQLTVELSNLRLQLDKYKPAHSSYKRIEGQIQALQDQIESLKVNTPSVEPRIEYQPNPQRLKLREKVQSLTGSLDSSEARLAELEQKEADLEQRHEQRLEFFKDLDLLNVELESMREQRITADADYNRKYSAFMALTRKAGNPFSIVEKPVVPDAPSKPNPYLIVAFSVVAGLALGLALAFLGEFSKNCFRSVGDISRVMTAPVLGIVNTIVTKREQRRKRFRQVVITASSLLIMGGVGWLTWAFSERQDLLDTELVQRIEDVRMLFR